MTRHPRNPARAILAVAVTVGLVFALGGCSTTPIEISRTAAERSQGVIESSIRTDQDRRMDAQRHPAEFLQFAQLRPGMQVLDVSAGAGYTSQLLALAAGPTGKVWAQRAQPGAALAKRLVDHPQANLVPVTAAVEDPVPAEVPKLDLITLVSARAGADITVGKTLHRIDEAVVLAEVPKAGFVLEAEGDFLRNPADTREQSSLGAKIPTDKFALRFVKP